MMTGENTLHRSALPHQGFSLENFARPTYAVHLDFFSGPLDLLLHLVHQDEVSIDKVDMAKIANQYLEIISQFTALGYGALDIEKAAEYLVIAATLVAIKSKSLLGERDIGADGQSIEDLHDALFYEELRRRLQAYELIKLQAHALRQMPQLGIDTFNRNCRIPFESLDEEILVEDTALRLGQVFARLLKRVGEGSERMRVRLEPVSVVKFMMNIVDSLKASLSSSATKTYFDLARSFLGADVNHSEQSPYHARSVIIGSFLALLELMRRGFVVASQENEINDISLKLCMSDDRPGTDSVLYQSEFDLEERQQEIPKLAA